MKHFLIILASLLIFAFLVIILIVGYTGFLPGVSTLMGTSKPRNLGVTYTPDQSDSYNTKARVEIIKDTQSQKDTEGIVFSGSIPVDSTFSENEISAKLSYSPWKYMPITNVQVKLSGNDNVEVSGVLRIDRLAGFINSIGGTDFTSEDVKNGMNYLKLSPGNPPVYAKGKAQVLNNQVSVKIDSLEVGRIPVPLGKIIASENASKLAEHIIKQVPGAYLEKVSFEQGKMYVKGTIPNKQIVPSE